jgi:hypothetical protein
MKKTLGSAKIGDIYYADRPPKSFDILKVIDITPGYSSMGYTDENANTIIVKDLLRGRKHEVNSRSRMADVATKVNTTSNLTKKKIVRQLFQEY